MIHQQVRAKKMIVLVYSCLLVLLAAWLKLDGLRPGLHSRMYVPLLKIKKSLDVDIVKSEAIPKSKHRNSMQLQSLGFTTESSHRILCVWECYGKEAMGVLHSKKKFAGISTYIFHVKKIGPKNPAHFLGILGSGVRFLFCSCPSRANFGLSSSCFLYGTFTAKMKTTQFDFGWRLFCC